MNSDSKVRTSIYIYICHFDLYPLNQRISGLMTVESHHRALNTDKEVKLIKLKNPEPVF